MRTESKIRRRLKQRRFRHEGKYIASMLAHSHVNCRFNVQCETSYGSSVCVCNHPDNLQESEFEVSVGRLTAKQPATKLPVCDNENGKDQSHDCGLFETRQDKETLKAAFRSQMEALSKDPDGLSSHYPDLAQLVWVLRDGDEVWLRWDDPEEMVHTDENGKDTVVEHGPDGFLVPKDEQTQPSLAEVLSHGNPQPGDGMNMFSPSEAEELKQSDTKTAVSEGVVFVEPLKPPKFIEDEDPPRQGLWGWIGALLVAFGRWMGG